ncbi:uncharacterized protein ARMOST_19066 [Armillaria ostoyae]|uniref:Uncharacterized protein n=1 Tax=Armillaria ostoyae TaxID=47428 RepID=A0A284S3H9_ARMOS|nr:uncharacterized protein ARMOST_19066 [Armillaria ostoyae]
MRNCIFQRASTFERSKRCLDNEVHELKEDLCGHIPVSRLMDVAARSTSGWHSGPQSQPAPEVVRRCQGSSSSNQELMYTAQIDPKSRDTDRRDSVDVDNATIAKR